MRWRIPVQEDNDAGALSRGRIMDKKIRAERAKQGRRGTPVLFVLVGGLILAMILWVVAELYWAAVAPETTPTQVETNPQPE
jgi:hypothetical protein